MKCSACSNPLDLPATHFLCMHSFHQRCLGDNEKECPMCAPSNRTILEIKRSQEANASRHDQFYKQLEVADDGFSVVADYFGRNVFNRITLMDGSALASSASAVGGGSSSASGMGGYSGGGGGAAGRSAGGAASGSSSSASLPAARRRPA